jgi:rhamnosyltransferase
MVAIHVHVYYEDLLSTIIKRLNKLPIKYDLYISTISKDKNDLIKKCLQKSNANKYEIKIYENKGRDVYSFISQMKNHYKNYKYICHLLTKKSSHKTNLGSNWSEYLYNNLIGNKKNNVRYFL